MDVYVDAQDRTLEGMMDAFVKSFKNDGIAGAAEDNDDVRLTSVFV